jgi:TRAP-type C4-dicarboxylate transport system permease small subunit
MSDASASPVVTDLPEEETTAQVAAPRGRLVRLIVDPSSRIPTYIGIAVVAIGFALIGIAWAKIAPLLNVALQLPYLVSAGFTGLALVMLGLIVINIAAKRQDAAELTRQLDRLVGVLTELQQGSDDEG